MAVCAIAAAALACDRDAAVEPEPPSAERAAPPISTLRLDRIEERGIVIPPPRVCIPAAEPARARPVLYATDGDAFLDDLDLCGLVARLAAEGTIDPWIVVGIPSTSAREEVLAGRPRELAALIVDRLEPALAALVSLETGPERRALIGYSYGGLAAIQIALARADRFGRVLALSPSLWWDDRSVLDATSRAARLPFRVYLDAGSREGDPGERVPYMIADVRALASILRRRGLRAGRDLWLREVPGHGHDMRLARKRLPRALRFALSR